MTDAGPPPAALVEQLGSADFNARALALAELVRRGRAAAPALNVALDASDSEVRLRALRGLVEIADPASAENFARFLDEPDERLRAFAAQGLSRIGDPRALEALVRAIDDYPDELHDLLTPAVLELIARGPAALPAVAPLLAVSNPLTRARAFLIVRRILEANPRLGTWDALAAKLGPVDPRGPPPIRATAVVDPATGEPRLEVLK
jgi:HEAT repeat protein